MSQLALDEALQVDGDGVGPGQFAVLLPPPFDHQRDIESQEKGDGDPSALIATPSARQTFILILLNTATVSPPYEFLHNYLLLRVETGAVDAGDY